eukprot:jgi/Psemu1/310394/fgenesh1_kg.633_\
MENGTKYTVTSNANKMLTTQQGVVMVRTRRPHSVYALVLCWFCYRRERNNRYMFTWHCLAKSSLIIPYRTEVGFVVLV